MGEFKVEVERAPSGQHVFRVNGELDHATAPDLRDPLNEAIENGARSILIDLTDCTFIDSTGLSVIVHSRSRVVEEHNGRLELCCPDPQIKRLLEITGIEEAFGIFATVDDALASLAG
jgi:anti-sigma B factor antagonist